MKVRSLRLECRILMDNEGIFMSLSEQRYRSILSMLSKEGTLKTSDLAQALNISDMTVRRDLMTLASRGLLKRIHGGATLDLESRDEYSLHDCIEIKEKKIIAQYVMQCLIELLERCSAPKVIYLDSGSTTMAVARELYCNKSLPPMTLVTHGINIVHLLANNTQHRIYMIGGEVDQNSFSTFGDDTLNMIRHFKVDLFLLGASGFNAEKFTKENYIEISAKQAIMRQSKATWLLLDSCKWQQSNFITARGYHNIHKLFLGPQVDIQKQLIEKYYPLLEIIHCY